MFGSIYAAFIAWCTLEKEYSIDSWRVYLVVCSIPALAAASSLFFFPESPEFYIMSGNTKKAFESFRSVCTWNGTEISEDLLFAETETLPIRRNSKPASSFSYREVLDKIMQLFSEEYRKLTLMSCAVWITISFAYYGYTTWQPQYLLSRGINDDNDGIQLYLSTLIITVFQLPGSLLSALSVDYFGRKKTLSASLFLSALAMLGIFLTGSAKGVFILACAYSLVSVGSWNMLNVLSSELFAPEVRATGYGVSAAAGRIGGILGTALFGVLSGSWAVLLCVCSLFVGSVSSYYLSKK
jgi:MFS family permease